MNDQFSTDEKKEVMASDTEEEQPELEEKFSDLYNRGGNKTGCLLKASIFGFCFVSLILIVGGLYFYVVEYDPIGMVCAIVGLLCFLFFFGVFVVLPYYQWKKVITQETQRRWKKGELTRSEILSDTGKSLRTKMIVFLTVFVFCIAFGIVSFISTENIVYLIVLLGCGVFSLSLGMKDCKRFRRRSSFYIVEDKVIDSGTDIRFDVVDALTTHLPDRVPHLIFEKYGKYDIDLNQIHKYYMAQELEVIIEKGEIVYIVCSSADNSILFIYRAKYRTLSDELMSQLRK